MSGIAHPDSEQPAQTVYFVPSDDSLIVVSVDLGQWPSSLLLATRSNAPVGTAVASDRLPRATGPAG